MKKILAGTSALIAVGLMASAAHAQSADPITLQLGGYAHWSVGYATQSSLVKQDLTANTQKANTSDVKGDHRLWVTGSTTLDNGLTVGVVSQFHPGARVATLTANNAYITVSGGFGTVNLGRNAHGVDLIHRAAPAVGSGVTFGFTNSNFAVGNWVANPTGFGAINTSADLATDNDNITYLSPSFSGFQVGASYVPTAQGHDRSFKRGETSGYGIGAVYSGDFNDVSVRVNAGHVWADRADTVAGGVATSNPQLRDWNIGAQVGFAGFTVGGGYNNFRDATSADNANAGDRKAWEAGVAYATGPYAVSLSYRTSTRSITGVDDPEHKHWQLGATYAMGPGVSLQAQAAHLTFDDTQGAAKTNTNYNQGIALVTGLALSF